MSDDIFDEVFDDAEMPISEQGLSRLQRLYTEREKIDSQVQEFTTALKANQERLREIDEKEFPELFDEIGVTSFGVNNRQITLKEKLYGSLPKNEEQRSEAIRVIESFGDSDIITANIELNFTKGEAHLAKEAHALLLNNYYEPKIKETVHAQTLQAWVREKRSQGKDIDLNTMGCYLRRYIDIK